MIGMLLGLTVLSVFGEEEPKADVCEKCADDSDCLSDLYCAELHNPKTGQSVGRYCIDDADRVCRCGYQLIQLCLSGSDSGPGLGLNLSLPGKDMSNENLIQL